jgi:hypothetical protein
MGEHQVEIYGMRKFVPTNTGWQAEGANDIPPNRFLTSCGSLASETSRTPRSFHSASCKFDVRPGPPHRIVVHAECLFAITACASH